MTNSYHYLEGVDPYTIRETGGSWQETAAAAEAARENNASWVPPAIPTKNIGSIPTKDITPLSTTSTNTGVGSYNPNAYAAGNRGFSADSPINAACWMNTDGTCNAEKSIELLEQIIDQQKGNFKNGIPTLKARTPTLDNPNTRTFDENFKNPFIGWGTYSDTGLIKADEIGDMRSNSELEKMKINGYRDPNNKGFMDNFFVSYVGPSGGYNNETAKAVNDKITELASLANQMGKFYTVYTGKNSSIRKGQTNFENLIGRLDELAGDPNFVNSLGEEFANDILNIAEDNIEQYHLYNYIPQDEEIQAFKDKVAQRPNNGYVLDPSERFMPRYYTEQNPEVEREAYKLMGVIYDENNNYVGQGVKNLYEISKYGATPQDFQNVDRLAAAAFNNFANNHYAERVLNSDNTFNENYYVVRGSAPVSNEEEMGYNQVANILRPEQKDFIATEYLDISAPVEYDMIQTGEDEEGNPILEPRDPERILDSGFDLGTQYEDESEFAKDVLISERPQNVSSAELLINKKVGDKVKEYFQQYEALSRDSLQKTIDAMKQQSKNEAALDMLGGIGSIRELQTFGEDIAEQIMEGQID
jgi:hypothetical protein